MQRQNAATYTTTSGVVISQRQLLVTMAGIVLGVLLSALDQTVVGPAMFNIIRDLKGLEHYAWVTTAYLLTSTVVVPIAGKLGDLHGRKWYFVAGMVVFMFGSVLSGLARGAEPFVLFGQPVAGLTVGMAELILFRAFQGVGGGLLMANAFTMIGDLVPPAERGRWQGLFGGVWGLASVIGPTVGGYITDNVGWQWVFYVNVPVGVLALAVVIFAFPELRAARRGAASIDWLGAATLVGATVPLLLGLSFGGTRDFPWTSPKTIGLFALSAAFVAAFLVAESRAAEPLIAPALFKNRVFTLAVATTALFSFGMFGAILYVPLFIQGVQGGSATNSGNATTPMMLTMVAVSILSGQIVSRTGRYRVIAVIGQALITLGMFLLSTMTIGTPRWQTIAYMVVLGMGMGIGMPLYTLIVQNVFPPQQLGVVTSATTFFRSIGGTIGVAILGTIVNNRFAGAYLAQVSPDLRDNPRFGTFLASLNPQALVSADTITALRAQLQATGLPAAQVNTILAAIQAPIRPALDAATTEAFLIGAGILALTILTAALIPEIRLRSRAGAPAPVPAGGDEEAGGRQLVGVGH